MAKIGRPFQTICQRGHDTSIEGRDAWGQCRPCDRDNSKKWRINNPVACALRSRRANWKNSGVLNEEGKRFDVIDYDRAYQIQQGSCKICKRHQSKLKTTLCTDHDHSTHVFRGLLCNGCNMLIGWIEKGTFVLEKTTFRKVQEYLKGSGSWS